MTSSALGGPSLENPPPLFTLKVDAGGSSFCPSGPMRFRAYKQGIA
jgi:hypothetical protein